MARPGSPLSTISVALDTTAPSLFMNSFSLGFQKNTLLALLLTLGCCHLLCGRSPLTRLLITGSPQPDLEAPSSRHPTPTTAPTRIIGGTVTRTSGVTILVSGSDLFNQLLPDLSPLMSQPQILQAPIRLAPIFLPSQTLLPSVGISADALCSRQDTTQKHLHLSPPLPALPSS